MTKKIVIAGCRDYDNYDEAKRYIDFYLSETRKQNQIIIISGMANGADKIGERYAKENGFKVERYPAEWGKYGKSAGPIRNRQMAEGAILLFVFGTEKARVLGQ